MASLRGHILNAAIRYGGQRRLAGLEFRLAAIARTLTGCDVAVIDHRLAPEPDPNTTGQS